MHKGAVFYGRYWGSSQPRPFLHFEACYYTPIQLAIEARAPPPARTAHSPAHTSHSPAS